MRSRMRLHGTQVGAWTRYLIFYPNGFSTRFWWSFQRMLLFPSNLFLLPT